MDLNKYQTQITEDLVKLYPPEVIEQLYDVINNIPFIKHLISPDRPYAKDLPRDEEGKIIVDISKPHILENMDYFRPSALHYKKHGCYTLLRPNKNPNSEYMKWIVEERRRCWEGYVRSSDGEWVTGYMYWYLNYCPIMLSRMVGNTTKANRVEDFPDVWEGIYWRFHYLNQARINGHHAIELARRGAHPYSQKVLTPDGWQKWEDITIGSKLFSTYNTICTVTDIPYDGISDYYKITLRDGREITASDDHLWKVVKNGKEFLKTTEWLFKHYISRRTPNDRVPSGIEYQYAIPVNQGVEFEKSNVPFDPYTLGFLIGDGCFRHKSGLYFTQTSSDFGVIKHYIPYEIQQTNDVTYRIYKDNWKEDLISLGLYMKKPESKFIPDVYKYNTRAVRLDVLRGLLDADGHCAGGVPLLSTVSEKLKDDVLFLARSLGYNCTWTKQKAGYKKEGIYIPCLDIYNISIYGGQEVFNLPRKKELVDYPSPNAKSRRDRSKIINIEYLGKTRCKCVTVDSKDNCYLIGDFVTTHNCSKSYTLASMMSHNFVLGENEEARRRTTTVLTAYQNQYLSVGKDGTLAKFVPMIDFVAENTQFPKLRLKDSPQEMVWQQGYKDKDTGVSKGSLNTVMGVSSKDDEGKLRGKRGYIFFEEMGSFPNLLSVYNTVRYGLEDGNAVFGLAYLVGTAAEDASDFSSAKEMLYNPEGYNIQGIPNVYDKQSQGKSSFGFFFPSYINRQGCYNKDGVSDVVKALLEILVKRYDAKYKTNDPKTIIRVVAEMPITPAEATIKVDANMFPVTTLTERLVQLDTNPAELNSVKVGTLEFTKDGKLEYIPTAEQPIRHFPTKDNKVHGAIEFYQLPEIDKSTGEVYQNRYILGHDPVDNDSAETMSLSSTFVLDLWTDKIVAEYTGRQDYADENYEICRKLCLFYNGKVNYEAHPYTQKVRLPNGETKEWGDIKIGDTLFSKDGKTVKVIDIPMDGEDDIYEITLDDGRIVEASSNHVWCAYKNSHRYELREYTTKEMFEFGTINSCGQKNFFLPDSGAIQYEKREVSIDPYTLGLLLAEGSLSKFRKDKYENFQRNKVEFSSAPEDFEFYKTVIPYNIKRYGTQGHGCAMHIEDIDLKLKELGLLGTKSESKFIPKEYLFNDYNTRLELLKGLMDGDGCAVANGSSIFITVSKQMNEDIKLLCRSLGIKCKNQTGRAAGNYIKGDKSQYWQEVYRVSICAEFPIFKLPRKVNKQHVYSPKVKGSKAQGYLHRNGIASIKYVGKKKCKCVTVDSPDGLYLIGDYIVTHNCNKKGLFSYFSRFNSTYLLTDTLQSLKDKQLIKFSSYGNTAKGTNATQHVNQYALELIRRWLLLPTPAIREVNGEIKEVDIPNLFHIQSRALLQELLSFNSEGNFDRVSSLGMLMLLRDDRLVRCQGNFNNARDATTDKDYLGNDPFFSNNYDKKKGLTTY